MALLFTTEIQTRDGFAVSNAYGRVAADDDFKGEFVRGYVNIYVSEQAFLDGNQPVKTNYIQDCMEPYNRDVDGTDILNIAHEGLISNLADQDIVATKQL